ncbi:polyphenol oxidase family protein [Candidatus Chromulinivorax destructor]|nr:polyphenol oxidase family protein [Candidatus Chromulinivorax destructor]
MAIHLTEKITIYFGDASQSLATNDIAQKNMTPVLQVIAQQVGAEQMIFVQQNHGVQGVVITGKDSRDQFLEQSGDFIITNKKKYGIGVLTADCLPIVIYDPVTHSAGIVHAGWKGCAANIFAIAIESMLKEFATRTHDLQIYFGPAAGDCCYQVSLDFIDNFKQYGDIQAAFIKKNSKIFFNSTIFTSIIARNLGIKAKNIYTTYNVCTICTTSLCSYRREKEKARRQITLISLH